MYPIALHTIPTQTVDSSQVFAFSYSHQRKSTNSQKKWDRNTIKDLEQVRPKQAHDFLFWLLSSKTILPSL